MDNLNIRSESYADWAANNDPNVSKLFVCVSGYETRATHWPRETLNKTDIQRNHEWLVIGFEDFEGVLSRPHNDQFYKDLGLGVTVVNSRDKIGLVEIVTRGIQEFISDSGDKRIEIHFDYSCMPRLWYCSLPHRVVGLLRPVDRAYFWYSHGNYVDIEYPTVGTGDFVLFTGRATLSPLTRTHILGLGLDYKRSLSIWSVLDPQNLMCVYSAPLRGIDYTERIRQEHAELLSRTQYSTTLPLDDFAFSFSHLCNLIWQFKPSGDVVLVPDGPKPAILAISLAAVSVDQPGVVCFHVNRRKDAELNPIDVTASGHVLGFSITGKKPINE